MLDQARYVVPVIVEWVIARGEVRRRRTQDELKADLRMEKLATTSRPDEGEADKDEG